MKMRNEFGEKSKVGKRIGRGVLGSWRGTRATMDGKDGIGARSDTVKRMSGA